MSISRLLHTSDEAEFTRTLLHNIGEVTPDFIFAKDVNSRLIFANKAVLDAFGKSWEDICGKTEAEWHSDPDEARKLLDADARVVADGHIETLEEVVTTLDGPQTVLVTKCPMRAEDGRIIGLFGIGMNITDRKAAERQRALLVNELEHRVRNTLGIVQVMARQTLLHEGIQKSAWAAFEGRLQAMAQAHNVLTRESWQGADIRQIVAQSLMVHGKALAERFDIQGSEVWIDAQNALSLAMALHELGTNAMKYGALSVPGGGVSIKWKVDLSDMPPIFDLCWQERGGPRVVPPTHKGFGTRLIESAFGTMGRDVAHIDYAETGVTFHTRFGLRTKSAAA